MAPSGNRADWVERESDDEEEEFQSSDEEDQESGSSYKCDTCPEEAEAWGSYKALKHHLRVAHRN